MCDRVIETSPLSKTWILDLDGTIVKHNGYKIDGKDSLLPGIEAFLSNIRDEDMVIFVTSRTLEYKELTEDFLKEMNIRYDHIIYGAPYGERILVNDEKPSGLKMALAFNTKRDIAADIELNINESL